MKRKSEIDMKYQKEFIRQIKFTLHIVHDADILQKLDSVENKQGYLKELIRRDINNKTMHGTKSIKPGEDYPTGDD